MGESESHLPVEAPDPAALSALLAGYDVQELVACGGMGAVYRGNQVSLDREVAIKVLPRELAEDEEFRASFAAEARAMAKLAHPNLISVYDFGEVEGMFYLVMEFVEGDSLYAACHDQLVDPQQAVEIVRAVSAGLGVAHEEGIIHRDIKPANILIGQDLVPKLGDFGLAVPSDDVASGLAMGTPGFVAPEVMEDPEAASPASDVFALGAMLHQMLSGVTPTGESAPDLGLVPLTHGLRGLVQKALSEHPSMRFQNGKEMADALGEWLEKAKRGVAHVPVAGARNWGNPVAISGVASRPMVGASEGGGGKLVMMLLLLGCLVGGGLWLVKGQGDDSGGDAQASPATAPVIPSADPSGNDAVKPTPKGSVMPEPAPEKRLSREEITEKSVAALLSARDGLMDLRREQLEQLKVEVSGRPHWTAYLELVDRETGFLPVSLTAADGVRFESGDEELLEKFVLEEQADHDAAHLSVLGELHLEFLREMKRAGEDLPFSVRNSWEAWVESLGLSPLHLLGSNLAGEWERLDSGSEEITMKIDNRQGVTISRGGVEVTGTDFLNVEEGGRIVLRYNPEDQSQQWVFRLRHGDLVGDEESGTGFDFGRNPFDLLAFARSAASPEPAEKGAGAPRLTDPELVELNQKYMAAVEAQIGPLVASYRKKVEDGLALARRRNDVRGVEQVGLELLWLDSIPWKSGCVIFSTIDWEREVPASLRLGKAEFDKDFKEKAGRLQSTYVDQLNALLGKFRVQDRDSGEIEGELARFTTPAGMVRARYLKIQANGAGDVTTAAIAEFTVLDGEGEAIPIDQLSIHSSSSEQLRTEHAGADRFAAHAIDGKPWTWWHSRWTPNAAIRPHWIAVDLGEERLVRGFRVLPRRDGIRHSDLVSWTLFASNDGERWREVASGGFEKGLQEGEFRFSE